MRSLLTMALIFTVTICVGQGYNISECIIDKGELKTIIVQYNQSTGEKTLMVNGTRKSMNSVYPPEGTGYAAKQSWYINSEEVNFNGLPYVKYGLPRVLGTTEIVKVDVYKGVNIYRESGGVGTAEVIYIPVRQGCEFQPYQLDCRAVYSISGPDSISFGKTVKLTARSGTGKSRSAKHEWTVLAGKIISGQGTPTITISTTADTKQFISVSYKIDSQEPCSMDNHYVYLKDKPKPAVDKPKLQADKSKSHSEGRGGPGKAGG